MEIECPECGERIPMADASTHWAQAHTQVAQGVVIPDMVGEVVAWRAWIIKAAPTPTGIALYSVTKDTLWPHDDWLLAECGKDHQQEGGIPGKKCSCGIYAAKTREQLISLNYGHYSKERNVVIGEVAMVGKVIPGSQGWRASKARVKSIMVPFEHWQMVNPLKETYNVPVELGTTTVISKEAIPRGNR